MRTRRSKRHSIHHRTRVCILGVRDRRRRGEDDGTSISDASGETIRRRSDIQSPRRCAPRSRARRRHAEKVHPRHRGGTRHPAGASATRANGARGGSIRGAPVAQRVHSMSSGEARSIHRSRASANPFTDALVSCVVLLQSSEITLALGCSHRVVVVRSPIRLPVRPSRLENVSNHDHGRVKRRCRPRKRVHSLSLTHI